MSFEKRVSAAAHGHFILMSNHKNIIFQHPHILGFGVLQIFFSAPGQTFLIALFVAPIFLELNVSQTYFAGIYSGATFLAALLLNPAGRLIDRFNIKPIIVSITILMTVGCWILASAKGLILIFLGFFILRLIGQGVYSLTASILISKQFDKNRGKAMGYITLGFPLSEVIYPSIALFLLSTFEWRLSYVIFGISNIILMLPIQLALLKKTNIRHGKILPGEFEVNPQRLRGNPENRLIRPHKDFTLKEALADTKFYLLLISSCLPPMVVTGLLFHQQTLFLTHQWQMQLAVTGLTVYAIIKAIGSIVIGPIVDRHGPLIPFIIIILILAGGTYAAALGGSTAMIFIYFGLIGAALGFSSPVMNVVWPYFYGTKYIGSIQGLVATFRNGVTAFGPLPIAMALDGGMPINLILKYIALFIAAMSILPMIVWKLDEGPLKG